MSSIIQEQTMSLTDHGSGHKDLFKSLFHSLKHSILSALQLYQVPVMPLLVNGKVDRQKLLAEYEHNCAGQSREPV